MVILEMISSTIFKHFKLQQNYPEPAYSTCIIQKNPSLFLLESGSSQINFFSSQFPSQTT